ncbi:FAD-binding oxidoreductase [Micromonospora sp. HUAS LYJ1]|uniref:NAD(P)/FAD-dependent oxidoreductase n=1 Tax=Micromonospora sp. HUAS LYJ1 TaxID=3061626 RepID=UPI0026741047|nr:FAD-dependent oxidoreductase [Micromonospora sp. HUAS LYJ1]WKU04472.1 FAD-dependent oxidoreductase [Micromonospora sp. HUAS LYJ1]
MIDDSVDVLVIGSGLCGLTIAVTAARHGLRVRCLGDGRPGASLANFGQLHSGAVYAPVLPALSTACWEQRDRWHDLARPAQFGEATGLALFHSADAVQRYLDAWKQIGIHASEMDPHGAGRFPSPAAAFRIPDYSVNMSVLNAGLVDLARTSGVPDVQRYTAVLRRDQESAPVSIAPPAPRPQIVVLAAGAGTPTLLSNAGIQHTLHNRRIAWGRLQPGLAAEGVTYWLDGDLLAISPDRGGISVGLPSVKDGYGTTAEERARLLEALDRHRLHHSRPDLSLIWGTVCEPTSPQADPSSLVVDLRQPPDGWTPTGNLLVALPGKWTTAWHCADRVVDALI